MSSDIKHVVRISTNEPSRCEFCDFRIDATVFAQAINHYIGKHGYTVMHVGSESAMTHKDETYHTTVAILGK